jgi:hypothetical protein
MSTERRTERAAEGLENQDGADPLAWTSSLVDLQWLCLCVVRCATVWWSRWCAVRRTGVGSR